MPQYIQLESSDGFQFVITKEAAMVSGMLRSMLNSEQFEESQTGRLRLDLEAAIVEKVCDYLCYSLKYQASEGAANFSVPPALALELLVAADYLDV